MMAEDAAARIKRMRMRAWRRGIKEMDLILGPYADERLAAMAPDMLATFDGLLSENDHDLYAWVTGAAPAPTAVAPLIADVAAHARSRLGPRF
jgi:antitoxin CptB